MRAIFIYDFTVIFQMLETDIIRQLVNTQTHDLNGFTINDIKLVWLRDRLSAMKLMSFGLCDDSPARQMLKWRMRNYSDDLDKMLYAHLIHIPTYCLQNTATLEIRGNDLYVSFGTADFEHRWG